MKKDKLIPHKNVMRSLKRIVDGKSKPRKIVNDALKSNLIKIIDKEIINEARTEALKILLKGTAVEIGEFLYQYHSESVVVPLVIDSIKDRLVKDGIFKFKKGDHFGLVCKPEFIKWNEQQNH